MRLDDPSDNGGRGWRRLAADEIADLAYLAIRLIGRGVRMDFADRNATKVDEATRKLARAVAGRLAAYPIFGPERPGSSHSARCRSGADDEA